MADKKPLPTFDWRVRIKGQSGIDDFLPVHASYFQSSDDNQFIAFKNSDHKTIYIVAKSEVVDIGRQDPDRIKLDADGRRP